MTTKIERLQWMSTAKPRRLKEKNYMFDVKKTHITLKLWEGTQNQTEREKEKKNSNFVFNGQILIKRVLKQKNFPLTYNRFIKISR